MSRGTRTTLDLLCLLLVPAALVACGFARVQASGLLTFVVAVVALVLFFMGWERSKPGLRQILPAAVLVAAAVVGRIIFAAAPNIQPVTAICIAAGAVFGKRVGFMTGAMTGLVSSLFLGLGLWTPWQMYAWGLVGYLAGLAFCREGSKTPDLSSPAPSVSPSAIGEGPGLTRVAAVLVFGFVASFAFGFIMNTWTLVGFAGPVTWGSAVIVYGAGFAFDLAHAISTVAFLALLYVPLRRKLGRVARKYDLAAAKA